MYIYVFGGLGGWQWLGNGGNMQRHKAQLAVVEIQNVLVMSLLWRTMIGVEGSWQVL